MPKLSRLEQLYPDSILDTRLLQSAGSQPSLLKRALGQLLPSARLREHEAVPDLFFAIDVDFTQPIFVGGGVAQFVKGWCYSQRSSIRSLQLLVDGVPYPTADHSQVRLDVFHSQCPTIDQSGNSLLSGFYGVLPIKSISQPRRVPLGLRAVLDDGSVMEQIVDFLDLCPGAGVDPLTVQWENPQQRVAICMTTYNPPARLFTQQFKSIREQTFSNWVCIISDDSSSPDSLSFIRKTIAEDQRFILLENAERLGFYRNFERCLKRVPADADFVALSDQDDLWFPDKLETLASDFQSDTQLVYSDMRIVTDDGRVISDTFWFGRKNNFTDLATLIFANTITGAASMFRAALLPDLLPFPEPAVEFFHDHWLALTALVHGSIRYVDRPLYDYYQHDRNIVGHRQWPRMPGVLGAVKAMVLSARNPVKFQKTGRAILGEAFHIYPYLVHRSVIAQTLLLRQPETSRTKRAVLSRIAPFAFRLPPVFAEMLRATVERRSSFALEDFHLRGALGTRLWNYYFRSQKDRLFQQQL
ncbi:MAG: glycosyltransferase, partial [Chloroflexota bacterium]